MDGAMYIAQGLVGNHSLTMLNLNNNRIGSKGI